MADDRRERSRVASLLAQVILPVDAGRWGFSAYPSSWGVGHVETWILATMDTEIGHTSYYYPEYGKNNNRRVRAQTG
eukprot:2532883-Pleurochrysis_carterae.AAC.2